MPGKIKLRILLISLAVILVIAAVAIPLIMKRDEVRKGLLDALDELAPFSIQVEKDAAIWHTANNYLMVSTADPVTQDERSHSSRHSREAGGLAPVPTHRISSGLFAGQGQAGQPRRRLSDRPTR